jgi:hypothetical protein
VTDPSGAAVPGASVAITHLETNQSRSIVTNEAGGYSFTNATPGTYRVDISKEGFQTFTARGIMVQTNSAVRVDAVMTVGNLSSTVDVTAEAAALQTDRSDVHTENTAQVLENVPVSTRSYQSLLVTTPGVTQPTFFQTGGINNPSRAMAMIVNGTPTGDVVVRIDGVSATNQWIAQLQAYTPGIEALEMVNTVTNSFDAEQGLAGGASINLQVKSGTNSFHGSAFEYLHNRALRARGYFLPFTQAKPQDNKNIFGGTLGGPIKKDKLFFFGSWEALDEHAAGGGPYAVQNGPTSNFLTLPDALVRSGNMSESGNPIYDPSTGAANGTGRTPFPGNIIPVARLNPIVVQKIVPLVPMPQFNLSANNYFSLPTYQSTYHKIDTKINWNATNRLSVYGRFSYLPDHETTGGLFPLVNGNLNPLGLGTLGQANVISTSVGATFMVTPTLVVDGVVGFTRQHTEQKPPGQEQCYGTMLGIPNSCQPPYQRDFALPRIDITSTGGGLVGGAGSWTSYGNTVNTSSVFDYLDPQYQYVVNAGWTKGAHNIRFGYDLHRMDINHYEITAQNFQFTGGATGLNGGPAPNLYNSYADFLLGLPASLQTSEDNPPSNGGADAARPATLRTWEMGLYVRDQWQVSRKLTASLGLRWEYYPVPTRADRGIERYDFTTNRLLLCGLAGNSGNCDVHVSPKQLAPRLGLAFRPTETFVIRAGFSLNWQNDNMYRSGIYSYPTQIGISKVGPNSFTPQGSISDGFPLLTTPDLSSGTITLPPGSGITTLPLRYVRGYIATWNVTLQKSFAHNFTAQLGYVGNRAIHMVQSQNLNYGLPGGGAASQPFFKYGITSAMNLLLPTGHTYYDSLQAMLNHRFSSGLTLNAGFTWSKSLTAFAGSIPIPQYWYLNKGFQSSNLPYKLTISSVYELPVGKGKAFLNHGFGSALLGGWQVNGLFSAYAGPPFSVTAAATSLNAPGSSQRANQVKPDVQIFGTGVVGPSNSFFDPTAFAPVTCACFGTAGVNTLRGPGTVNLDAGLFRQFRLKEKYQLQFRAEAFNVSNTPHFGIPGSTNISNVQFNPDGSVKNLNGFGVITATNNSSRDFDERYFRLGLRLSF